MCFHLNTEYLRILTRYAFHIIVNIAVIITENFIKYLLWLIFSQIEKGKYHVKS